MRDVTIVKRYAEALFEVAENRDIVEIVKAELHTAKQVAQNDAAFLRYLSEPKISLDKKKALIETSFAAGSIEIRNTLKLLLDAGRISSIPQVADVFQTLYDEKQGTAQATVYSVRALSEAEKKTVAATFAKKLDKKAVSIDNKIDPTLLGGLKVRIGNTIYDSSIKNQLTRIERNLVNVSK
ncbi:F-type H+-transporting ATPase subunit delta [Terribacillus halophilus]|uniref:ATP synthase subunit delta n=1 Tax=Terribacillus halophilus TaxID=361279 RepID=A0A1G6IDN6_9BACI|nr:F0F1 ATP synthase subunit delta [Terribacillus halophilus]SDC03846.1 F-type H+-transporting ATPase subunit delta [Terribacillus halophilus]